MVLGCHQVVRGAALSSVPVVEDKLSLQILLSVFLVDLYVASAFFWLFISSLFCGLKKKSGLYCKNSVVTGGQYPGSPYLF